MSPHQPVTLLTASPAEGQVLARRLAQDLLAALPPAGDMAAHLRPGAVQPAPELVTAIYFHAIALANAGWGQAGAAPR